MARSISAATTHVDNLVHGIALALERGRGGEAYFITDGEPQEIRRFVTDYAATVGEELPDRSVPAGVARLAARVIERTWTILRPEQRPPLTRFAADTLASTITARNDKARRELGYEPRVSVTEGLAALAATT